MMVTPVPPFETALAGREGGVTTQARRLWDAPGARQITALSIVASLVILLADRTATAGNMRGAGLAAMCASCHRLDGRDKGIPSIVGMDKANLAGAMAARKSGVRSSRSQIMHAVALSLTDDEIATLAEYLATLPKETTRP
jgi:cytochrome subunit of sulfide dehydrogenase